MLALGQDQLTLPAALGFALLKMLVAAVAIFGIGRAVLDQLFWQAASIRAPETFAALTLLIALATGWLAQLAGLSMAFGAFLAGMLLAGTKYRHQVAAEILPFRGLLLGLFYMAIGMSVAPGLALEAPATVPFWSSACCSARRRCSPDWRVCLASPAARRCIWAFCSRRAANSPFFCSARR